uniref:E3 ubiquitin-protein ligase Sina-like RING finger domain-containing protein n=1 Tax=Oryza nivara TaxID=4536 RepID=A0A0E0H9R2_ORYNI
MAALDHEGDTMARKKRRVYVAIEEIESHGHEEDDDGGEEVEEEDEQSHGEADGDGDDAAAAMEESDGHDEEGDNGGDEPDQSPDGDDMEEEEERGGGGGGGVHGGEAEVETFRHSEQASSARPVVAVAGVTVEDADALECGVCCLPLRPPIFQCEVGHVVCAPCRDKLAPAGRCHVCRAAPLGRAISVLCIHPHAAPAAEMQCELRLHVSRPADDAGGGLCISHYQKSVFHIGYSDLADGVPDRRRRFQFVVPRHVVGGDNEDGVQIRVRIKY